MPPSIRRRSVSPRNPQRSLVGAVVVALIAGLLALVAPSAAVAAEGSIVDGGFIISDADFFDSDSMTAAQIQTFLNGKVTTCKATSGNPTCLKSFTADLPAFTDDKKYCSPIAAKTNATSAEIIATVSLACGISPKVILVMLQKEQGLVTSTAPGAGLPDPERPYKAAMGQGCPDGSDCNAAQAGFVNQVYYGARQLQVYTQTPSKWNYKIGTNTIQWHTNKSCGTSTVKIQNQATANLYIYTPYRPNIAAMTTGYVTSSGAVVSLEGDSCSTYGNRNFYNYYQAWFKGGSDTRTLAGVCAVPPSAEIVAASGYMAVTATSLNVRSAPTTTCSTGSTTLSKGAVIERTGTYGAWTRATVNGKVMWLSTSYLTTAVLTPTPTISGTATAGQILTAKTGTWSPKPASYSYQWKRSGTNVAGATASTYRVTNDDAGKQLTVTVTAKFTGAASVSKTSAAVTAKGFTTTRLAGVDRYRTASAITKSMFPDGVDTVYLATGTTFPDALSVAPLVAHKGAALLLTAKDKLSPGVAAELKRLAPKTVVLIGSELALDAKTPERVRSAVGGNVVVTRLQGPDRYGTSRAIASQWTAAPTVFIATGASYPDALGAGAAAGDQGAPLLLVPGDKATVNSSTLALLSKAGTRNVVLIGSEKAVSAGISTQLTSAGFTVTRLAGETRYGTNAAISKAYFSSGVSSAVLATGANFPDGLTGSVLAATRGVPLLISVPSCLTRTAGDYIRDQSVASVSLVGAEPALSANVGKGSRC